VEFEFKYSLLYKADTDDERHGDQCTRSPHILNTDDDHQIN